MEMVIYNIDNKHGIWSGSSTAYAIGLEEFIYLPLTYNLVLVSFIS